MYICIYERLYAYMCAICVHTYVERTHVEGTHVERTYVVRTHAEKTFVEITHVEKT